MKHMILFHKYHGLGNDFIIIDNRQERIVFSKELIKRICHRNFGIGADGIVFVQNSEKADIKMVIFNSDGSKAEMCGNASRCFAKYVYEKGILQKTQINVETLSGIITPEILLCDNKVLRVKVNMGKPIFDSKSIPCAIEGDLLVNRMINIGSSTYNITALLMGVPHVVVFTKELEDNNVISRGKLIEESLYFPQKTNVNFVDIINRNEIIIRTWERGAGYTYACGTGACASVVAGILKELLNNKVLVHLRGGDLIVSWDGHGDVYMEGEAKEVFSGEFEPELFTE